MAKAFKMFFRKYTRKNEQKPISLFLMGALDKQASIDDNSKNLSNRDIIHAHRSFFPQFVAESLEVFQGEQFVGVQKRFESLCFYNGHYRELYPSFIMMSAYKAFEKPERLTYENLRLISMLAWCFEALVTSLILVDDVIDNGEYRWKNSCWYRQTSVGLTAINDINLLRSSAFYMMRKYFAGHHCYEVLFHLLKNIIEGVAVGQTIDINLTKAFKKQRDVNLYKSDLYLVLRNYKCYIPLFRNGVLAVMYLLNRVEDFYPYENTYELLSLHLQITNDMWDCFGRYESFGKDSTDIKEGKLTWLIVKALEHADEKQKVLLQNNYGRDKPECEKIVLDIFRELDVVGMFYKYKTKLLEDLRDESKNVMVPEVSGLTQAYLDMYVDVNEDFSYD